ncbi:MAG: helix-turn-helix transcriptional regulator [Clostridia bacterium]|nr:helix-turn-helix transcriptional regulator [Clostridia bacterium]
MKKKDKKVEFVKIHSLVGIRRQRDIIRDHYIEKRCNKRIEKTGKSSEFAIEFSINLKFFMARLKVTESELGERLGVSQQTVSRWVSGVCEPSFAKLLEICFFLRTTPDKILGYNKYFNSKVAPYIKMLMSGGEKQ